MKLKFPALFVSLALVVTGCINTKFNETDTATLSLKSKELSLKGNGNGALKLDGLFYETAQGRVLLPEKLTGKVAWVGADTCGYGRAAMEQEVCARWLAFSCFNPIMEVGPTRNVAFWNLLREPKYDATLIATWRLYARLHQRLVDYSYAHGVEATQTGMPIARPLFLVEPKAQAAWDNWWTYLYGRDILVSPIWEKNKREQEVYLPSGEQWRDAWNPEKIYAGGQSIKIKSELHHIPIFVRVGSNVDLGDLNKEWAESWAIAQKQPDLKPLDAETKAWLEKNK